MTVGWLAGTVRSDDGPGTGWGLAERCGLGEVGSTMSRGNRHYNAGIRADDWSWQVLWEGVGDARGTVYVEVRQSAFEGLGEPLGVALTRELLGELRPTRLDLAGDCGPDTPTPARLFDRRADAWTRTQRGRWELTLRGDGGQKLTVGARSSDRYLRVYVKGDRIRHELELKGATGRDAGAWLAGGAAPADVWHAQYGRLVQWR